MYWKCAPYFLVITAFSGAVTCYSPCLTSLAEELGKQPEDLSKIFVILSLGFFSMVPICYRWAPRLNKDLVLFVGVASLAIALLIPTWFTILPVILITAYALGAGSGIAEILATAALSDAAPPHKRRALLNFSQTFYCVGAIGVPILFGLLFRLGYSWRDGFRIVGALCAIAALAIVWHARHVGSPPPKRAGGISRLRDVIANRSLLTLILGLLLYVSAEMGYAQWIAVYFEKTLQAPRAYASIAVSLFWAGQFAGRILYGLVHLPISDRHSIIAFTALCLLASIPILFTESYLVATPFVFLVGLGCSIVWPTIMTLISRAEPNHTEAAFSLAIGVGALGYLVGPPLVGAIARLAGSNYRTGMASLAILLVANIALFSFAPAVRKLREAPAGTESS